MRPENRSCVQQLPFTAIFHRFLLFNLPNQVPGEEAMAAVSISPVLVVLAISVSPGHCAVTAGLSPSWVGSSMRAQAKATFSHQRTPTALHRASNI